MMVDPRRPRIGYSRPGWFNAAPSQEHEAQAAAFYGMDRRGF
jgi:hypothetical protein